MDIQKNTFTKGDWIVHAYYGVGQVREKEKKELDGEKQVFYRVETLDGEYWLSASRTNVEYIRPIASEYQIRRALAMVRKKPRKLPESHIQRSRMINEAIKDPSLYPKACMMRDLSGKGKKSELSFTEEDALLKMKNQFLDEWSVIKNVDREILEEKLDNALNTGN